MSRKRKKKNKNEVPSKLDNQIYKDYIDIMFSGDEEGKKKFLNSKEKDEFFKDIHLLPEEELKEQLEFDKKCLEHYNKTKVSEEVSRDFELKDVLINKTKQKTSFVITAEIFEDFIKRQLKEAAKCFCDPFVDTGIYVFARTGSLKFSKEKNDNILAYSIQFIEKGHSWGCQGIIDKYGQNISNNEEKSGDIKQMLTDIAETAKLSFHEEHHIGKVIYNDSTEAKNLHYILGNYAKKQTELFSTDSKWYDLREDIFNLKGDMIKEFESLLGRLVPNNVSFVKNSNNKTLDLDIEFAYEKLILIRDILLNSNTREDFSKLKYSLVKHSLEKIFKKM